ncbi:TIM barrel protein [Streptomyces phaeochromogenes]|uniref:TIM barrel protein n=1 Tax=Streptomyces phaeochromogenes TaxID=1923 RepID=UPI003699B4AB
MFDLSASVSMVEPHRPLLERVRMLDVAGLGVGLWDPRDLDLDAVAGTGARISIMNGFTTGNLVHKAAADAMVASAEAMIPIARRLGTPLMNLHGAQLTAEGPAAVPVTEVDAAMTETAYATLARFAELGEAHGVVFGLENLNPFDHPGVPLARAEQVVELVRRVDHPHLRMNFDVYHAARGGEEVADVIRELGADLAAEVQLADSPGREWPGGRLLDFPAVRDGLVEAGYRGSVALEGWIRADAEAALREFVTLFRPGDDQRPPYAGR